MKIFSLLLSLFLVLTVKAWAEEYRVYESGKPVISRYVVKSRPDGSTAVYDSRQVVIPKYIVRPNQDGSSSVYESGKPVLPVYRIEKRDK